jgi:hypothetical protein
MVECIYVQAFKRTWTKIKLRASYCPFWHSKWSEAMPPPCLSIVLSMEKEWWASCGEGDPYTSWPWSLSSFKSSPMHSKLLSVEELELLPIAMCLRIIFTSCLCYSFVLQHILIIIKPCSNPSWYRHHRLSSSPYRCLIFHIFSFTSRTGHVLKHPSKLKFMKLSFQRVIIRMNQVPNKRVEPILLRWCNLSKADFRLCSAQILPYLLVQVFKIDDPWCVGKMDWRSFWKLAFLPLYISEHVLKLNGNSDFHLKSCRWLTILIAIGQELMGTHSHVLKTNQIHILPIGWWSGVETIAN